MTLKWKPPKLPQSKTARYSNTASHAAIVHEGAELKNGGIIYGREYMLRPIAGTMATENFVAEDIFADAYRKSRSFPKAFRATAQAGQKRIKEAFSDLWIWPSTEPTKRRNGAVVTTPRDIIDTGKLQRSQQPVEFL